MNRRTRTAVQILGIILLTALLSVIAYYIGSALAKSFLPVGQGITHTQWQGHYKKLVYTVGITACALSLAWYFLARFGMKVYGALNVGRRGMWALFGSLTLLVCLATPYIYAGMDATLKINASIPAIFVVLYALIGYWGGSIATAPAAYKYTPLGADKIRAPKGRK